MKYYEALQRAENGEAVTRTAWTLSGKWVKLDPGSTDANRGIQPRFLYYIDDAYNKQVFEPSLEDQNAEDWKIFGEDEPVAEPVKDEPKDEKPVLGDPNADKNASKRPLASAKKVQDTPPQPVAKSSAPVKDPKNGDDEGVK